MRDKIVFSLLGKELKRQDETIDLIASENYASKEVLELLGSVLTNKYSEGYPGRRYYPGNIYYDEIERLAQARALKLFKLNSEEWAVNVQPYSGSPANLAIYTALMEPGETIMGMALTSGGHLTHGHKVSATGKFWRSVQYGVNENGLIDFKAVEALADKERPRVIVSGFTAYPRTIDFKRFGEITKKVGAYHAVDISHIAGLIAGGAHPSPFPYADVVMTTTHKTLRGPRGAIIFSRRVPLKKSTPVVNSDVLVGAPTKASGLSVVTLSEAIDKAVFPGLQGGPHNNVTAAKAATFLEALQPSFRKYAAQVVKNAWALASELTKNGAVLVTGGTDNHLMLLNAKSFGLDGMTAEKKLEDVGIIANRNTIPGDVSAFKPSGVRIGTPAVTTRGMKEREMRAIARLIKDALTGSRSYSINKAVKSLAKKFPIRRAA